MVRPPYQVAVRLCAIAAERWAEIEAHYYQINLLRQRPARFLNLVYAWCIGRITTSEDLEKFEESLIELLPWQDADSDAAAELEAASFRDMMNKTSK